MPAACCDSAKIHLGQFSVADGDGSRRGDVQKDLKKLPEYAQAAAEVNCTRCVVTLAPAGDSRPYHENFEFHRRRLHDICRALQPAGVSLAIGFRAAEYLRKQQAFQFIHDLNALTLLVNMVDAPNVGVLVDVWDVVAGGGSLDSIRKLPAEADSGRPSGGNARRRPVGRVRREVAAAAGGGQRADRRCGRAPVSVRGGLRRARHSQALARHLHHSPPRPGRQAGGRGHGPRICAAAGLASERKFVPSSSAAEFHTLFPLAHKD